MLLVVNVMGVCPIEGKGGDQYSLAASDAAKLSWTVNISGFLMPRRQGEMVR